MKCSLDISNILEEISSLSHSIVFLCPFCIVHLGRLSYLSLLFFGTLKGQGLWIQQTWLWHKPSWRRLPLTPPQSHQNLHRTGDTHSWRAQMKPYAYEDTGERSSDPTRDWPRLVHEFQGVSSQDMGWWWPAVGSGALSVAVCAWDILKEVAIIFITSTIVWSQVKQQRGNTNLPNQQKIGLKIYWVLPHL